MKKIKFIVTIVLILILSCAFLGCGQQKNPKEGFVGYMSVAYETASMAAEAYFNDQIKGGEYEDCKYKSYTSKKALSKGEIEELNLGDYTEKDIIHAEKGKVSITYDSDVFLNTVYILQTEDGYHYYTVKPNDEEAVCYDYYEYLISDQNFDNVTVKTNAMIILEDSNSSRQIEVIIEYNIDGENVKFDVVIKRFFNGGISETSLGGYVLSDANGLAVYGLNEKEEYLDITDEYLFLFSSQSQSFEVYIVNEIVNLYKNGHHLFKVNENEYVLRNKETENLSDFFIDLYYGERGGEVDSLSYKMSVKSDKITSLSANIHSLDSQTSQDLYVSIETSFTKYGETEVEIPEEVQSQWENR